MVSEFDINGNLITHDIVSTNGYTRNLLQNGTVTYVLGHNKGKWSNKFSAVEIIIDHIYIMNADTVASYKRAFRDDDDDHHHGLCMFDSNHNSHQEAATHLDQPRLMLRQLS